MKGIIIKSVDFIKNLNRLVAKTPKYQKVLDDVKKVNNELLWRNYFIDTVSGYEWYNVKSLSLGRWAIGYNFAYILARALEASRPHHVLELGLGQSSKIINSYVSHCESKSAMQYDIIEQDINWINFFKNENVLSNCVKIHQKNINEVHMEGGKTYLYENITECISGKKYSLVSIDGPWGGDNISRIDLIEYIPDILEKDFIIIIDDYERVGEKKMVTLMEERLKERQIEFYTGVYQGEKDVCVIASPKWRFVTSL